MSVRSDALKWLVVKHGESSNKTVTSKYYLAHESWSKTEVWWVELAMKAIDTKENDFVNILCQVAPLENEFHYLKVPVEFLKENFDKFHKSFEKISLYLSANSETLFIEERGEGRLDFSKFLVE